MMGDPEGMVFSEEDSATFGEKNKKETIPHEPNLAKESRTTEKGHDQPLQTVGKEEERKESTSTSFNLVTFE